jgi:choline dehydrogenase
MDQPNLTVLTHAMVQRLTFIEVTAVSGAEVVLSLGAIHTPKVLMQSGIGDQDEL